MRHSFDPADYGDGEEKQDVKGLEGWTPSGAVAEFLREVAPMMLGELIRASRSTAFARSSEPDKDSMDKVWKAVAALAPTSLAVNMELSCTSVSWNATGSKLCCGYGSVTEFAWSEAPGMVRVWNVFAGAKEAAETVLDTPSGIMSVAFHPSHPAVFATGGFNGQVMLWDLNVQDKLIAFSHVESYTHRDPVVSVAWIRRKDNTQLVSLSAEGRVLLWDPDSYAEGHMKLQAPVTGLTLSRSSSGEVLGGKSLAWAGLQQNTLLVGAEGKAQ